MNKTVVTVLVVAGVAAAGYLAWKAYQKKNPTVAQQQQPTKPNSTSQDIVNYTNALNNVIDSLGG